MTATAENPWMAEFLSRGGPMVEFENVSIGFEGNPVLRDISFQVALGETRILLGPAGGGKSVLMKLVNGLLMPDRGRIRVFGRWLNEMNEDEIFQMRAHIGIDIGHVPWPGEDVGDGSRAQQGVLLHGSDDGFRVGLWRENSHGFALRSGYQMRHLRISNPGLCRAFSRNLARSRTEGWPRPAT